MPEQSALHANLAALQQKFPYIAGRLLQTDPSALCSFMPTRSGHTTLCLRNAESGEKYYVHSKYNPVQEAERLYAARQSSEIVFFLGLGCAYHILPYIYDTACLKIIIIESSASQMRSTIEAVNLCPVINSGKLVFLLEEDPATLSGSLKQHFQPYLYSTLQIITLPALFAVFGKDYRRIQDVLEKAIENQLADMQTMQRFGRRWTQNFIRNIFHIQQERYPALNTDKELRPALLIAAGPTLEEHQRTLHQQRGRMLFCAVDSALPFLQTINIVPDIVLSIDCQIYSRLHFRRTPQSPVLLYCDLTSPPCLRRLNTSTFFFAGGHPLSCLLRNTLPYLLPVDTAGRNVSTTAINLLSSLGYRVEECLGADFSYLPGKPYVRESYIYTHLSRQHSRMRTQETCTTEFILKDPETTLENITGRSRYTPRIMQEYAESFLKYCKSAETAERYTAPKDYPAFRALRWLEWYRNAVASLSGETQALQDPLSITLIPYMIWLQKHYPGKKEPSTALQAAIRAITDYIDIISGR